MRALLITGDRPGAGKTSITLALAALLKKQGIVQTFKVGMDYIDPSYLAAVWAVPAGTSKFCTWRRSDSRNLLVRLPGCRHCAC